MRISASSRRFAKLGELIGQGLIGTPHFARITFRTGHDIYAKQPYLATEERFAISDVGVHVLDMARFYLGEVTSIACRTRRVNPKIKGEDSATMLLEHAGRRGFGGRRPLRDADPARPVPRDADRDRRRQGGDAPRAGLPAAHRYRAAGSPNIRELDPEPLPWAERPWHVVQESVQRIEEHWVDCLRRGVEPETSGADNLKTFAVVEAAYRSAATGETVHL